MKNENGVTLVILVIAIIILIILAGIAIIEGNSKIKNWNKENIITDMILIKGKAKEYAESVNTKTWNLTEDKEAKKAEIYNNDYGMIKEEGALSSEIISQIDESVGTNYTAYKITKNTLTTMQLDSLIENEKYLLGEEQTNFIVVFNNDDNTYMDVAFISGYSYKDNTYYTLSSLQKIE